MADLELTKPVLESFYQSKTEQTTQGFLIQYPYGGGQQHNFIYYLEKNRQCSLHSKDYFQLYQKHPVIPIELEPKKLDQFAFVSLDECARLCFRHELPVSDNNQTICLNFTYCPVLSLCHFEGLTEGGPDNLFYSQGLSGDGNGAKDALTLFKSLDIERHFDSAQQCHHYERNYQQYFNKHRFSRMSIRDSEMGGQEVFSTEVQDRLINLNLDRCVRHCLLADEKCLSFDYCRASMRPPHTTCVINKIRSPNVMTSQYIDRHLDQLTEMEKKYYLNVKQQYKVELRDQEICDHYALIDTYAEIKMSMVKDRYLADSNLMQQDQDIAEGTPLVDDETIADNIYENSFSFGTNFSLGLIMGVLLYLMGPKLAESWVDWRQEKAARATQSAQSFRFSVLNLARNEQTQQCD